MTLNSIEHFLLISELYLKMSERQRCAENLEELSKLMFKSAPNDLYSSVDSNMTIRKTHQFAS